MGKYVDGFVLPIPRKNAALYRRVAKQAGKIWREHGALASFVWFSWIAFNSRAHRDRVNAAVMKDPRMVALMGPKMPRAFDGRRMIYGGFKVEVDA